MPSAAMIACCGYPLAVFFIWTIAMKAPHVIVGTCTAIALGGLRRNEFRISPSRATHS